MTHFPDQKLSPDGGFTDGDSQDLVNQYNHKKINFMRYVDRWEFFQSINFLLVLSKHHEGIGRVVIEANACGITVIANNDGALPGLIKEAENGWIFNDMSSLKTVLSKLIESPLILEKMKDPSMIRSCQFRLKKMLSSYSSLYRQVVSS